MTHSSIRLWSISFLSAVLAPLASAEAGWRDGLPFFDPGWYDDEAPPIYERRRALPAFPAPRDGGIVARMPDGELIIVYPEDRYGYGPAPDVAPRRVLPPRPRPRKRIEAMPRPPALVREEPVVVPGIVPGRPAPRAPVRIVPDKPKPARTRDAALAPPKSVDAKPVDTRSLDAKSVDARSVDARSAEPMLADPMKKPEQPQLATPKIVPATPPRVAQARIALPVPRPNLESMDFAPAAPALLQDKTAGEDRR